MENVTSTTWVNEGTEEDLWLLASGALTELNRWLGADTDKSRILLRVTSSDLDSALVEIRVRDVIALLELPDPSKSFAVEDLKGAFDKSGTADALTALHAGLVAAATAATAASFFLAALAPVIALGGAAHVLQVKRERDRRAANKVRAAEAITGWTTIEKFIGLFLDEIKSKVCKGRKGDARLSTSINVGIPALSGWLVSRFGLHDPVAYGIATAILIALIGAARRAFCQITVEEYMALIGFSRAGIGILTIEEYKKETKRQAAYQDVAKFKTRIRSEEGS